MKKDEALNELIIYIQNIGIEQRGGITKFLKNNFNNIESLTSLITFKEIIEHLNKSLNLNFDYKYFNLAFNKIKKENNRIEINPTLKKELDLKQINQQPTRQEEVKEPEKTPLLDIDTYSEEENNNPIFSSKKFKDKLTNRMKEVILKNNLTLDDLDKIDTKNLGQQLLLIKINEIVKIKKNKELSDFLKIKK